MSCTSLLFLLPSNGLPWTWPTHAYFDENLVYQSNHYYSKAEKGQKRRGLNYWTESSMKCFLFCFCYDWRSWQLTQNSNTIFSSAARKFSWNFGQKALKFRKFRLLFSQISGYFGRILNEISKYLTLPYFFIAFLCDNFSKIWKKILIFFQKVSKYLNN